MLPRGIKFAYLVMMIAAALIAFISLRSYDEMVPGGPAYTIYFGKADDGAGAAGVAAAVEAFSREHGVNVGRLYDDPLNGSIRRIYLAVGDPGAESTHWLAQGYPYFSRGAQIEVRPYSEISAVEPDGTYLVYGSEPQAYELLREFTALGYRGDLQPAISVTRALRRFGHGAIVSCFLAVGLAAIVAVTSAIALNAKSYGIQRLQGQSLIEITWRDLQRLARFCLIAAVMVGAAAVGSLFLYNGLHQFGLYVRVALFFAAVYGTAVLLVHGLTLALLHRSSIVEAVKGEVTATWAITGSYVLRCWGLLLLFSISTSVIASGSALNEQGDKYRTWSRLGSAYYLRINGAIDYLKDGKETSDKIGQWIRDSDARNEVSLASHPTISESGRDLLVVNNRYLGQHAIRSVGDSRVKPEDSDAIRILIPRQYSAESVDIESQVIRWAKSFSGGSVGKSTPELRTEQIESDQSLVFYSRSPSVNNLTLKDPVVVVVTGASRVISNDEYVTMASTGGILVADPDRAMRSLTAAGVGAYILGMSPFAQDAANEFRDAKREFDVQVVNSMMGIAVLVVTALSVSVVYCRRNIRRLFVKYIHGWWFGRMHWRILAIESTLGLLLVLWAWNAATAVNSRQNHPGGPPILPDQLVLMSWGPIIACGIALASVVLIVFTLTRTTARFNKGSSEIHS